MIESIETYSSKADQQVHMQGTQILQKELDTLQFSVWDTRSNQGHSQFVGDVIKTAQFLENEDRLTLEVSALDLAYMRSLEPVPANDWLSWYYQTALSLLEEHDFNEHVLVPYPTKSIKL